jgi:acetolactate synthase-1/2/3 large subunit
VTNDYMAIGNAGESFLRLLASRGVDFCFANSGTDFPSITEALARARQEGFAVPRTLLVPHENVAVGMAYGVTMVTGRAQAVMVHVNVGTANALCGLINAARENVPMLLAAGRTPLYESGRPGSRSLNIHWAQEMYDQGGMLREFVKWDYELRSGAQMESVVDRALAIARSEPQGPVYLSLPREALAEAGVEPASATPLQNPSAPPPPDPEAIERAASLLSRAKNPLVITARAGREPGAVPLLQALAERYALPVVEFRPRYLSLAASHPMHAGYEVAPWLDAADAILVLDCDVPWIPAAKSPAEDVPVIQVGSDPLFARYPLRGFRGDIAIACTPQRALAALTDALARSTPDPALVAARRTRIEAAGRERRAALEDQVRAARSAPTMGMAWVSRAIAEAVSRAGPSAGDAIYVNEYSLVAAAANLARPGSYFGSSPVGGLGWGLPAALGAKLAAPDKLVIATLGDGSYTFSNPLACHHAAAMHGIPVLTVVMNNRRYGAVERATRAMYPQGVAVKHGIPLVSLDPLPRYDAVIAACGGHGERIEQAEALPAALDRAIRAVLEGRQALLDVACV